MSAKSVTLAVAVAVLSASTAFAQGWHEYVSRDEFFLVGMPSAPQITSTTYRAASGAMLPAIPTRAASRPASSCIRGTPAMVGPGAFISSRAMCRQGRRRPFSSRNPSS